MRKEEVWAVGERRISNFFLEQPDGASTENSFAFRGCRVTVTALESRRIVGMALPQTRIIFEGEEDSVIPLYRRFLLRFLSAGG